MEKVGEQAQINYDNLSESIPGEEEIEADEDRHEHELIALAMAGLNPGVAVLSFGVGYLIRIVLGVYV